MVVKPKLDDLYVRFLEYMFRGAIDISKTITGAAQPQITRQSLSPIKFSYPPLTIQKQIVEKLDAAFAEIDKAISVAQQNAENAKALFQSYLNDVFSNKLGYELKPLNEVSKIINGYAFKSIDFRKDVGIKSIKITNVGIRNFVEDTDEYLPLEFASKYSSYAVKEAAIVIPLTRTIIGGGLKVAIVPKTFNNALLNQRVAAIIPNDNLILNELLYYYLTTSTVKKYVIERVNTLMQPNLSIKDLCAMPIPIIPVAHQRNILNIISQITNQISKLQEIYEMKCQNLNSLKKSILTQAFNGELTKA